MKKILFLAVLTTGMVLSAQAQNTSRGKGHSDKAKKEMKKDKDEKEDNDKDEVRQDREKKHDDDVVKKDKNRSEANNQDKEAKNVPTKVKQAFGRDYPNAKNVTWTKSNGNWTATYGGVLGQNTATYHANGKRLENTQPTTNPVRKAIGL